MRALAFAFALTLPAVAYAQDAQPTGKLPDTVTPLAYRLDLTIVPDKPRFSGHTEIDVQLNRAAQTVWMSKFLLAPMPGLLTRLHVGPGDRVEAGQPLAVVEAMKMENILRAERAGVVKAANFGPGDSLAVDAAILEFE